MVAVPKSIIREGHKTLCALVTRRERAVHIRIDSELIEEELVGSRPDRNLSTGERRLLLSEPIEKFYHSEQIPVLAVQIMRSRFLLFVKCGCLPIARL